MRYSKFYKVRGMVFKRGREKLGFGEGRGGEGVEVQSMNQHLLFLRERQEIERVRESELSFGFQKITIGWGESVGVLIRAKKMDLNNTYFCSTLGLNKNI